LAPTIRQQMFGQGKAHFTGIMAWRGLYRRIGCPRTSAAWSAPTGWASAATSLLIRCAAVKS
jgi:hypothetical protein